MLKNVTQTYDAVKFEEPFIKSAKIVIADKEFSNADLETRTNVRDTNSHYLCDMSAVIGLPYQRYPKERAEWSRLPSFIK